MLASSSDDDQQSEASKKTSTKYLKWKKKKAAANCKHEQNELVEVCKTPGMIYLHGALSKTNEVNIYTKIKEDLMTVHKQHKNINLVFILKKQFEQRKCYSDDIPLMTLIQGLYAAKAITGDHKSSFVECKKLKEQIPACNLRDPFIISSTLFNHLFLYYMRNDKVGKAYSALQIAVNFIQEFSPSPWTALVYHSQGLINDRLAQIKLAKRKIYQDVALKAFKNARDHYTHAVCQVGDMYAYYPILYTIYIIYIQLDMPIIQTIVRYANSTIVCNRLRQNCLSDSDIEETRCLLNSISKQKESLAEWCKNTASELVLIGMLYLNIRKAQLALESKEYATSMDSCKAGLDIFNEWKLLYCIQDSCFKRDSFFIKEPSLARDIKIILDELQNKTVLQLKSTRSSMRYDSSDTSSSNTVEGFHRNTDLNSDDSCDKSADEMYFSFDNTSDIQ